MFFTPDFVDYLLNNPAFAVILSYMFDVLDNFYIYDIYNMTTKEIAQTFIGCLSVDSTVTCEVKYPNP